MPFFSFFSISAGIFRDRIVANLDSKFLLSKGDFEAVNGLNKNHRIVNSKDFFGVNVFQEEGEPEFCRL